MDDLEIRSGIVIPGWELWMTASRSGGPGGQHANKSSTKVTLYWDLANTTALTTAQRHRLTRKLSNRINGDGLLFIEASESRSQHRNRDIALERLRDLVIEALKVEKRRVQTRPSRAARKRRLENKRQRGRLKSQRQTPDPKDYD
ncbi:MAG: alternative ribosome rescue aminoacyl-tRNA hydrolase ArfB [Bradymonadaceae bacterium]